MDKNKFKKHLEAVAVVETQLPKFSKSQVGMDDDDLSVVKTNGQWVKLDLNHNPTLGFKMVKLKDVLRPCDLSCGDVVPNQVVEKKFYKHPYPHWRTYCKACSKYVSPDGKEFISGNFTVTNAFENYYRKRNKN